MEIVVRKLLLKAIERVYFNDAPKTAVFPYVVFDFETSVYQRPIMITQVNVHIWDQSESIATILLLEKKIIKELNGINHNDNDQNISIYLDRILKSGSEDPTLKRKTLVFDVRTTES